MRDQRKVFSGRSFLTTLDRSSWIGEGEPVWEPLKQVARLVQQSRELPHFHPGEFMYMVAVLNKRQGLRIHLYKHIDTRHYLNLDDAGHAYAYQYRATDPRTADTGGRYRRYSNLADAIARVDLDAFERIRLFRSFPPEEWAAHPW